MSGPSYERVSDLAQALALLSELGPAGVPLAGATDLMPDIRQGRYSDATLVDVSRLDELKAVRVTDDQVYVGSLVTAAELGRSAEVERILPILVAAARSLGSPQIRARATVGGNVVNASPAADMALALMAMGAVVETAALGGPRSLPLEEFVAGPGLTRLVPGELVTGFRVSPVAGTRQVYLKVGLRRALACAVVSVAVAADVRDGGRRCAEARIVLGSVAPTWLRVREAEVVLTEGDVDAALIARAARLAAAACSPIDDVRATASYRRHLVRVYVARALETVFAYSGEGG